jgi:3-keto-5-aminohexanoate cleavage enzyme
VTGTLASRGVWHFGDTYEWMERLRGGFAPMIITCAINGGVQGKESNPSLPETPVELAAQAYEAYNAGASIVHVHARNPANLAECTADPDVFLEINALIRERCPDLIINNTTGGGPGLTMEDRYAGLEARPEMASLNLGPDMSQFKLPARPDPLPHPHAEIVVDECIPFTYGVIEKLATLMLEKGIKPEMEIYQPGMFWASRHVIEKGLVEPPYLHQFVMGYQTSSYPTLESLAALIRDLPAGSIYAVCGIGPYQLPMTTASTLLGGHVRVGLEDNIYYRRGQKLRGNGEAVERAVRIANELNREIATPAQARELLGLSATPSTYGQPTLVS